MEKESENRWSKENKETMPSPEMESSDETIPSSPEMESSVVIIPSYEPSDESIESYDDEVEKKLFEGTSRSANGLWERFSHEIVARLQKFDQVVEKEEEEEEEGCRSDSEPEPPRITKYYKAVCESEGFTSIRGRRLPLGGIFPSRVTPKILNAARFAIDEHNEEEGDNLILQAIVKVNHQFFGSYYHKYFLTLEAINENTVGDGVAANDVYEAIVYKHRSRELYALTVFRKALHYTGEEAWYKYFDCSKVKDLCLDLSTITMEDSSPDPSPYSSPTLSPCSIPSPPHRGFWQIRRGI